MPPFPYNTMLCGRNRDEMCFVSAEKLMLHETIHLLRHIRCGSLRNATVTQYHSEAGHAERVPPDRGRKPESTNQEINQSGALIKGS